jgi:tetratricopeptide (TPR) repeat protein
MAGYNSIASLNGTNQQDERNQAIELFHSKKFTEALPIFKKLSDAYPADYLLKYFTGATLVELGDYSKETEMYLLLAGTREVPARVFYYLARYYHAIEDWDNAVRFYNRYRNQAHADQINELRINELTDMAYNQQNPFTKEGISIEAPTIAIETSDTTEAKVFTKDNEVPTLEEPSSISSEISPSEQIEKITETEIVTTENGEEQTESPEISTAVEMPAITPAEQPDPKKSTTAKPVIESFENIEFIHFRINSQIIYLTEDLFQDEEAKNAWKSGKEKENELNQMMITLAGLREQYKNTRQQEQKEQLTTRILHYERQTLILRSESDQLYQQAQRKEQTWWAGADATAYSMYRQVTDSLQKIEEAQKVASAAPPPVIDHLLVYDGTNEPDDDEIPEDEDSIVYKVQLGAFTGRVPARTQALFDKISRIRPIETFENEKGATVYTTGNMRTFEDGIALQNQVRLEGIKDAFVIAIKDGKRISLPDANTIMEE